MAAPQLVLVPFTFVALFRGGRLLAMIAVAALVASLVMAPPLVTKAFLSRDRRRPMPSSVSWCVRGWLFCLCFAAAVALAVFVLIAATAGAALRAL